MTRECHVQFCESLKVKIPGSTYQTDVHYPTDINLLYDAMRKVVTLTGALCDRQGLSDWRQHAYNVRHLKRLMRAAQNRKRSRAHSEAQQEKRAALIRASHQAYLDVAERYLAKARDTLTQLTLSSERDVLRKREIEGFMHHATRQIDQTKRRVTLGEVIPHGEKVFSLFEPHTEWLCKGKAGVPVELGVKVCVLEDQHQFILHHRVMEKTTDDQVTVPMVTDAKNRFPDLRACSFDKGFHSPENQRVLKAQLELAVLPRKGRLSLEAQAEERTAAFIKARRQHSAVESAINALEAHGLDHCPDHGVDGFKRYAALAVVARNIHRIGDLLKQQAQQRAQRKRKYADRDTAYKRAA
jgi:transposase, IS5 family